MPEINGGMEVATKDVAYTLRNRIGDESRRWKNVTLKIMNTEEELTFPLMQATTVYDVKAMLAEALSEDHHKIEIYEKVGCKFKKMRHCEEIATRVLIKGVKNFARKVEEYPHQFVVIGGGHLGLRQAMHWKRQGQDFQLFERKAKIAGNAWNGIANKWSKLQSEGPHYHLNWDSGDGREHIMMMYERYSFWPTRDEIIAHFHDIVSEFNLWPRLNMSTQIMDMDIIPPPTGGGENLKTYRLKHCFVGEKFNKAQDLGGIEAIEQEAASSANEGYVNCSCLSFYPGALAVPHRKTFPGEDVFGGNIGYGFNDEFDYSLVVEQDGIVIGMGAFCVENMRTLMEHNAKKFYVLCRHHNLLLPRVLSWWVNQSRMPPPAAQVLKAMEPIYKLYGADPWSYFSVTATADRTHASIKQYTRWGIGDIYFLGVNYGKIETIEGEVKRLKYRTAVINTGRVLDNLDHMIKCLGFDSDFGVDKIMKTKMHIGFWPNGDFRRWVCSDQSAIDASRFGGTAIAPYAAACTMWPHHFFKYPMDAKRIIAMGIFPENKAKPELGSAAYHYEPRTAATVQVTYGSAIPEIGEFSETNDTFKKESMWISAPAEKFLDECEKDWYRYCQKFKDYGDDRPFPKYPYDIDYVYSLLRLENEDRFNTALRSGAISREQYDHALEGFDQWAGGRLKEEHVRRDAVARGCGYPPKAGIWEEYAEQMAQVGDGAQGVVEEEPATFDPARRVDGQYTEEQKREDQQLQVQQREEDKKPKRNTIQHKSQMAVPQLDSALPPRTEESFLPAKHVLHMRARSPHYGRSPSPTMKKLNQEWLSGAYAVREHILQAAKNK